MQLFFKFYMLFLYSGEYLHSVINMAQFKYCKVTLGSHLNDGCI